jgi:hypothetical protein
VIKSVVEAYSRLAKRDLRVLRLIEAGHRSTSSSPRAGGEMGEIQEESPRQREAPHYLAA